MATTKKPSAAEVNENLNVAMLGGEDLGLTASEAWDIVEKAGDKEMKELTADYLIWKPEDKGVKKHFILLGLEMITIEGKAIPVARLQTKEGKLYLSGDKVLYSACSKVQQLPCYLRVMYTDDLKSAEGTYKNFSVKTFPLVETKQG